MIEEVGSFGIGLKQSSLYEISTWVLKIEVEDTDKIKMTHMAEAIWMHGDIGWMNG